jgi:hypothetical protein
MRQAIITNYVAPTHMKGARICARAWGGKITIPRDYDLTVDQNHFAAAMALCNKLGWTGPGWEGTWVAGGAHHGNGHFYVFLGDCLDTGRIVGQGGAA